VLRLGTLGLVGFAAYHLARDVLTTFFDVHWSAVDVGHRRHQWCGGICDYVTMPLEVFNIVVGVAVLQRRRVGAWGLANLATIALWLGAWLAP